MTNHPTLKLLEGPFPHYRDEAALGVAPLLICWGVIGTATAIFLQKPKRWDYYR